MINYDASTKVKFKKALFCGLEWPPVNCCNDVTYGIFRKDYKGLCIGCPKSTLNIFEYFDSLKAEIDNENKQMHM